MLREKLDYWAAECPQRIAHCYRDQRLNFLELKVQSDALALWINWQGRSRDIRRGTPIIIFGHKQSEMLVAFLACIKAGHPYIPVDVSTPPERLRQILLSSGSKLLMSPQEAPDSIREIDIYIEENLSIGNKSPHAQFLGQSPPVDLQVELEEPFYIIYTSGSTGVPKGVKIPLRALESFLNWVNSAYQPQEKQEVFLNQAPFSFDLSVMDLYMSLSTGGTLWSVDKDHIANLGDLFASFKDAEISYWVSTPSFAELCLMDPGFKQELLPRLKRFLFCGEVLSHECASKLISRFPKALAENLYGPTEATVAVTTLTITHAVLNDYNPLPVGKVKEDCRILICNTDVLTSFIESGCPGLPAQLPEGERGEIIIAGPSVSTGYLNNPELSRKAFFSWYEGGREWHAYRTGDAGLLEKGLLFFFGRLDFQVKLHGYRIELGDIEENLRQISWIENAVVLPIERKSKVEYLQAFVISNVPIESEFTAAKELREALCEHLPEYMIPRRIKFLPRMPMTPNGKVDRRALLGGSQ